MKIEIKQFIIDMLEYAHEYIDNIRSKFRSFKTGILNLYKWRKIIWNDRDYDYRYLCDILKFKTREMEKFFRSDKALSVTSLQVADDLKEFADLLDKATDEFVISKQVEFDKNQPEEVYYETIRYFDRLDSEMNETCKNKAFNIIKEKLFYWWD